MDPAVAEEGWPHHGDRRISPLFAFPLVVLAVASDYLSFLGVLSRARVQPFISILLVRAFYSNRAPLATSGQSC